jgi:hypothetical protein
MANPIPGGTDVQPLYMSRDFLLTTIRMDSTTETQTLALVNQAITDVRLEIFSAVTSTRALEIAGYTEEVNPTSANGILRARAKVAETYWVIYKLVPLLPTLFIENQHTVNESFNDEPLTRDSAQVKEYMDHLKLIIDQNMLALLVPPQEGNGEFASALIERQDENGDADPYIVYENFIGLYPGAL